MFTGIIEEVGKVVSNHDHRITIETALEGLKDGDSLAVNGVCLTVAKHHKSGKHRDYDFEMSKETLSKTCLGLLKAGDPVNLERPLTLQKLIGGHLVSGHVDAGVLVLKKTPLSEGCVQVRFELPRTLKPFVPYKGSITVDGVSLTVTKVGRWYFETVLVPHTLKHTNLSHKDERTLVNIEVDFMARYLHSLLEAK